jgi:threonine 3-dehydrogenase
MRRDERGVGYAVARRAVLVSGGGRVGLVVAYLSRLMGAAHVIVIEPNPYRRAQAEQIGALWFIPRSPRAVGRRSRVG